jgi:hypothetical protein
MYGFKIKHTSTKRMMYSKLKVIKELRSQSKNELANLTGLSVAVIQLSEKHLEQGARTSGSPAGIRVAVARVRGVAAVGDVVVFGSVAMFAVNVLKWIL